MTITDDRPTTACPPWCRTDHAAEMQRHREMAEEVDRYLGVPPLRSVSFTDVEPGQGFVVDTYLLHQVEVGRVTVRVGRAELARHGGPGRGRRRHGRVDPSRWCRSRSRRSGPRTTRWTRFSDWPICCVTPLLLSGAGTR